MPHHAVLISAPLTVDEALPLYPFAESAERFLVPYSDIGIDEVRALTVEASMRPKEGDRRLLIVAVSSLTREAQQALLKLLEEPPRGTSFLFIIPPHISILSTLASRFYRLPLPHAREKQVSADWKAFAGATPAERLEEITKRLTKKDTDWVEAVKTGLSGQLALPQSGFSGETVRALSFVLTLLDTRGASNKLLLEELALTLPSGLKVS